MRWVALIFTVFLALGLTWACSPASDGDGDGDGDSDGDADGDAGETCSDGDWRCYGAAYQECTGGEWANGECDGVCAEGIGCAACHPGERYCEDNNVMECNEEGSGGELVAECDPEAGYQCTGGSCSNACEEALETRSNVGCEYWAVDLDNAENRIQIPGMPGELGDNAAGGQFAVAVANTDPTLSAHVTATINNAPYGEPLDIEVVAEEDVPPNSLKILELPRRDADGDSTETHVDEGPQTWVNSRAFKIQSTAPVVAYQFNTIDQRFSNDASLLLPSSGLDTHHIVLGYPPNSPIKMAGSPKNRCYVTVLGTRENTHVKVTSTARTVAGGDVPQLQPGDSYECDLGPYDMLNLETDLFGFQELLRLGSPDLTGSVVESHEPVAVFFGCDLAVVAPLIDDPTGDGCCAEHLESQILPTSAMGKSFIVTRSPVRSTGVPEVDVYRVMAVVDDTQVTTNLDGSAASFSLAAGEFFEFDTNRSFVLQSTQPVHVGQYMISQGWLDGALIGDPSFLMFPALEEWRGTYIFTTGRGFSEDWVVVAIPEGGAAQLDDVDIRSPACEAPVTIGDVDGTTYEMIVCPIEDGVHIIDSGETPTGVTVYGYYGAGSYSYSAGSELHRIFLI